MSQLEASLAFQLKALQIPQPAREYRFAAEYVGLGPGVKLRLREAGLKDWRFDFAWPDLQLAAEVEGGGFVGGRHTRGAGFRADCLKYHHALDLGWTVYRCEESLVKSGLAAWLLHRLIERTQQ